MEEENKTVRKPNKFAAFLKAVFVHNFGWKALAVVSSAIIWMLVAGLW